MENQTTLPVELVYKIFGFMAPRDVVRMRTVSKLFRAISHDTTVWRTIYAHASLPRPSGPFPSQSVKFLERTLVKSERLARSWTTQPMRYNSSIQVSGLMPLGSKIVNGKWYISCHSSGKKIVAYDLDSETVPFTQQVLWEQDVPIRNWNVCSMTSSEGPVLYILANAPTSENPSAPWKLLEFRTAGGFTHLSHSLSLDVPMQTSDALMGLDGGHTPFLYIGGQRLIFDSRTRQFYTFPPLEQTLDNIPLDLDTQLCTLSPVLTSTHIVVLHRVYRNSTLTPESTLVQAFTLPTITSSDHSGPRDLRLSHAALIHSDLCMGQVIRNSVVNPVNGETNMRLLAESLVNSGTLRLFCIDLTLPNHTHANMTTVLPVATKTQVVLEIETNDASYHPKSLWLPHVEASDDGYARGFWQIRLREDNPAAVTSVLRYAIDASGERCVGVLGKPLPSQWHEIDDAKHWTHSSVDLVSGKLLYSKMEEGQAVLVDFE